MSQKIEYINIRDLVLWTENPRDPITSTSNDQDIADRAFSSKDKNWDLKKLAKKMGPFLDFSENPTVVFHGKKPVVYDGNRRVLLGKVYLGLVRADCQFPLPEYPESIPCNVCDKDTALANVLRKHADSGSWKPLERDIFLHKYMGEEKSVFLQLEDETNAISNFPHLNQGFVKKEIFSAAGLDAFGFISKDGHLHSKHNPEDVKNILRDIAKKVGSGDMSTRKNRGQYYEALDPSTREMIDNNKKDNNFRRVSFPKAVKPKPAETPKAAVPKQTQRKKYKDLFWGGKLYLVAGTVNNLYRDIDDLNIYYQKNVSKLTGSFPHILRMSLRLLCETAAKDKGFNKFDLYLKKYFAKAKSNLGQDEKTTLANYTVTEKNITQLLQTGAHGYKEVSDYKQTLALSIIIGEILKLSHSKE